MDPPTPSPLDFGVGEASRVRPERAAPSSSGGPADDPILHNLQTLEDSLRRLTDHALIGYSLMTTTQAHMNEVGDLTSVEEYFEEFYRETAKEFIQKDDYAYATHHCLRTLYGHWQEEMADLKDSAFADIVDQSGGEIPSISKPTHGGRASFAPVWYEKVREPVDNNVLPAIPDEAEAELNPIIAEEECVFDDRMDQRYWGRLLNLCIEVWARQVPLVWSVVRATITLNRLLANTFDGDDVATLVDDYPEAYPRTLTGLAQNYNQWRTIHKVLVNHHDDIFATHNQAVVAWLDTIPDRDSWSIMEATKYEMYLEVAANIATLKGRSLEFDLPEFDYWRVAHFAPACLEFGAPGMPPFETVEPPAHTQVDLPSVIHAEAETLFS